MHLIAAVGVGAPVLAPKVLWNYTAGGTVESSPAVVGGVVYIGSDDGNLYALQASNGQKIWNYTTGSYIESSPCIANGVVYIGSDDGNLYAINATTGQKIWNYSTGNGNYILSCPTVVNGVVYVGSFIHKVGAVGDNPVDYFGYVYAFSAISGI